MTWLHRGEFLLIEFLESTLSPERDLPIYFNYHYKEALPEKVYYYNIEQLTRQSELETIQKLWAKGHIVEVWDYSSVNCQILTANNILNRHVPFTPTPKRIEFYKELLLQPKIYDVGFCGASSPRRDVVLKGLRDAGLNVLALHNAWGEERDRQLARSKVIVNIHYQNDYKVFETSRCGHWLAVGHPVVSEESLDSDPRAITVPYDKLVETTIQVLKDQKGSILQFCACSKCAQPWTG